MDNSSIDITVNDAPSVDNVNVTRVVTPSGNQAITIEANPQTIGEIDWTTLVIDSNGGGTNGVCDVDTSKKQVTFRAEADAQLGQTVECVIEVCEKEPADLCVKASFFFEIQDVFNPTEDALETTENTPLAFISEDLLNNDGNADKATFEILNEDPDAPGTFVTTEGGTITFDNVTGEYTYTPPADFTGEDIFS